MSVSRRSFLAAALSMPIAGCAGGYGSGSWFSGAFQCARGLPYDTRVYPIILEDFEYLDLQEQQGAALCWAAAIQAILNYHGEYVSQREIVEKVRGASSDRGYGAATLREVIRGISGPSTSWHVNNGNSYTLVADLDAGNPVIVGLRGRDQGHIVVVYGVTHVQNYWNGATYIDRVWIWDPFFGEGLKIVSGCEIRDDLKFALHAWNPRA